MIKQYKDNMDLIVEVIRKVLNLKPKDKLQFNKLNETFDADFSSPSYKDDKLLNKFDTIAKKTPKYYYPMGLFLLFRDSFEYIIKYEDRYLEIKNQLEKTKDLYKLIQDLKEDMWPFYPFFQEALVFFSILDDSESFSSALDPDFVLDEMVRQNAFYDDDGDVVPYELPLFLIRMDDFFTYSNDTLKELADFKEKNPSFHQVCEIKNMLLQKFKIFELGFMSRYQTLYQFALMQFDKIDAILKETSVSIFDKELNATYKYIKNKYDSFEFKIKTINRLEDLNEINDEVNDLYNYSVERYNEYVDFVSVMYEELPESFNKMSLLVTSEEEGSINYLYTLIDEQIAKIEVKYEERKRLSTIRDLSTKIKNFCEFLMGLKDEIGNKEDISKKKIGNFTCKSDAEFLYKRLLKQKENYLKHIKVFDYLTLTSGITDQGFKIYTRLDFQDIAKDIRDIEKFLIFVSESVLPENNKSLESDVENEGRQIELFGKNVKVQLMNEDYSEISFDDDIKSHTFNIHDYSAYHKLVDYAVDVRKQPVFQDYGDISEYPYFKPFKYQVESVRTMLGKFEGRGVFGDQVGLGKTLEALMTADVMFRCATIKNCVIVTTKSTIHQWRNECNTKFRHEDGTPMFEVYPKHDSYSFIELIQELKKDKAAKNQNALKVYLVSTEQIKSSSTLEYIKESSEYFQLKNSVYNPSPDVPNDIDVTDMDINKIMSIKYLDIIKKRLPKELSRKIKEMLALNEDYQKITAFNVYGFYTYEFDEKKKLFYSTNERLSSMKNDNGYILEKENELLQKYSKCLVKIEERKAKLIKLVEDMSKNDKLAEERLIDLLIFDEVQDLLIDFNKKGNKEEILQEFIANIQKKYCILISATPIRNDLSDIFNLLYMVDKNRLGENKEMAEAKFYNAYCGGARSLAEMAAQKNASMKFSKLNGLINSMFTRKRLYDKDVIESIRRHSATEDEIRKAMEYGRDDYGGQSFIKLVSAIRKAPEMEDMEEDEQDNFISKFIRPLFPKRNISNEILKDAFLNMASLVDQSVRICTKRLEYQVRMKLDLFNVYDKFIENYRIIIKSENENDLGDIYKKAVDTCDLLCSYINRGLLAFYRSYHKYSTVFMSDFIDWRRPRKMGEAIDLDNDSNKIDILTSLLTVNDDKFMKYNISKNNLLFIETAKTLIYERKPELRVKLYKNIRNNKNLFNQSRRVYMSLHMQEEENYTLSDFIHFGYFPQMKLKNEMKDYMKKISEKNEKDLTYEEKRLLDSYTLNGSLKKQDAQDTFRDLNYTWFTEFTSENENWNSLYFIDKTMVAGTDFNAANLLIIGQLDKANGEYMDPLELEQLIGRISRMGQTETCLVLTCLSNGDNNIDHKFNREYYNILTDEEGFDLYGVCQTEVDFVMPVIMAVTQKLFSKEASYVKGDNINLDDNLDFVAVYHDSYIEFKANRFPDIIRYALDNNDKIDVYYKGEVLKPIDAIKNMIRLYSKVLRNDVKNI